jgi:hypothetical protein
MTKTPHESDVEFIQALAELLNKNELAELSVKREYGDHDSLNMPLKRPRWPMHRHQWRPLSQRRQLGPHLHLLAVPTQHLSLVAIRPTIPALCPRPWLALSIFRPSQRPIHSSA